MLAPGDRIGPFEVLAPLGAGGMGEVYRARDPRLGREVAVKVLPAERMADEGRRRRLVREARSASALNHPHIVTVHEIGSSDGIDFIVMEYVPGQTLDGLIPKSGLPLRDALRIAVPIADAMAAAHSRGIVHRDLKPANVIVTREGAVKVVDFGLAKLVSDGYAFDDAGETRTEASDVLPLSRPGTVTGTSAYMSPEQAVGGMVDARSDIFSFGAVLYEMVTGRRAFTGRTASETRAAVVGAEPQALRELQPGLPEALERLILRCLRKEADRRFQHVSDVRVELRELQEVGESGAPVVLPGRARRGRRAWIVAGVLGALVLSAVLGVWLRRSPGGPLAPTRVVPLTALPGLEWGPTFSPDGRQVAFAWDGDKEANRDIYVKLVGSSEVLRLTTDPAVDTLPSWSPDGRRIAFVRAVRTGPIVPGGVGTLHLVSPLGGPERRLGDWPVLTVAPAWSPDSRWLVAAGSGVTAGDAPRLHLVPVDGGEPRPLLQPRSEGSDHAPALSPDGKRLAYASCAARLSSCDVYVVDLGPDLVPTGSPRQLTSQRSFQIHRIAWLPGGEALVYDTEVGPDAFYLWRVGTRGADPPERLEIAGMGARHPSISGERLAFTRWQFDTDIVQFAPDTAGKALVASSYYNGSPQFSPDGRQIAFESMRSGERQEIWLAGSDGRSPEQLTRGPGRIQGSPAWSPDGRHVAFDSLDADGRWDIWTIAASGDAPRRLTRPSRNKNLPWWSRDGRWVYFHAERQGRLGPFRVPAEGGAEEPLPGLETEAVGGVQETADGRMLLSLGRRSGRGVLFAHPRTGGPRRKLADCVLGSRGFAPSQTRVYYAACSGDRWEAQLRRLDLASGREETLGVLERFKGGLSVSPDGKTIVYTAAARATGDLMLVEGFR